jgi:putative transposase
MSSKYGKRYKEEEIFKILREASGSGKVEEVLRRYGVSSPSYYKWRSKYGGMEISDIRRLKELEIENQRLKRLVADQALDILVLKDVNSKKW